MIHKIQSYFQSFPHPFLTNVEQVCETGIDLIFERKNQKITVSVRERTGEKISIRTFLDGLSRNFRDHTTYLRFQKDVNDCISSLIDYQGLNVE